MHRTSLSSPAFSTGDLSRYREEPAREEQIKKVSLENTEKGEIRDPGG